MSENSLTRREVRDYDARAIENGVPGSVLMENAARGAAELLLSWGVTGPVSIVCGKGNNGGDGFAIARILNSVGKCATVELFANEDELRGDARTAFLPLGWLGIKVHRVDGCSVLQFAQRLTRAEWIIDALFGTGTAGEIRSPFREGIEAINAAGRKVMAIDLPSGLDADTGNPLGTAVRADLTATFVGRKRGFDNPDSQAFTGPVYVLPIAGGPIS